jgi:hypothetical protein
MQTYYIVRGETPEGHPEYQFSDDLPGKRSVSYDFLDIADGIRHLGPAVFIMVPRWPFYALPFETPEAQVWRIYDEAAGEHLPGQFLSREDAETVIARLRAPR